jgi:DNA-directed RNA polymerase beta subunit
MPYLQDETPVDDMALSPLGVPSQMNGFRICFLS